MFHQNDPALGRAVRRRAHFTGTELKSLSWSKCAMIFPSKKPIGAELCWGTGIGVLEGKHVYVDQYEEGFLV